MADREHSPAFAVLPRRARLVFAAIQRAIGDGSSASVTYLSFKLDHGIGRKAIPRALTLLDHLGLIDIEGGRVAAKSTGSRTAGAGSTRPRLPAYRHWRVGRSRREWQHRNRRSQSNN